jgi:acyl dehydratase
MDVAVGDVIPPFEIADVDPEKMKTVAALIHDPNPIHWDVEMVERIGMGDRVINQGPSNMAYVIDALIAWTGDARSVRNVKMRFNGNVFGHDRVVATGVVTDVSEADGERVVSCDVWLERGEDRVVSGTARLVVPAT